MVSVYAMSILNSNSLIKTELWYSKFHLWYTSYSYETNIVYSFGSLKKHLIIKIQRFCFDEVIFLRANIYEKISRYLRRDFLFFLQLWGSFDVPLIYHRSSDVFAIEGKLFVVHKEKILFRIDSVTFL